MKIKSCPFCACQGVEICRTNENACWIRCGDCGADSESHKTKAGAIKNWNRRNHDYVNAVILYDGDADYKRAMKRCKS